MECGLPLYKIYFVVEKLVLKRYKKIIFLFFYNIENNLRFKKNSEVYLPTLNCLYSFVGNSDIMLH